MVHNDLVERAIEFAEQAHGRIGQVRMGTKVPYIVHPMRVMRRVMSHPGASQEMIAAAVLHDTVEDTGVSLEDIRDQFGTAVADIVDDLTNRYTKDRWPQHNRSSRKQMEIDRLSRASREAKIIKMIDRIDNLHEGGFSGKFMKLYADESRALADAVGDADSALKDELIKEIEAVERQTE